MEVTNPDAGKVFIKYRAGTYNCYSGVNVFVRATVYIDGVQKAQWGGYNTGYGDQTFQDEFEVTPGNHTVAIDVDRVDCTVAHNFVNHHQDLSQPIDVGDEISNLNMSPSGNDLNVNWSGANIQGEVLHLRLEVKNDAGQWATTQLEPNLSQNTTNHTFNNIVQGQEYRVQLTQYLPSGTTYSQSNTTTLQLPSSWEITGFLASTGSNGINISWNHPSAKGHIINPGTQENAYYILK